MAQNWLCAVALVPCFSLSLVAQDPQPAPAGPATGEVVKVEAHRSKWDYPTEVQVPAGHTLHIVAPGDTLWALGQKYLGNPYAWPQIWEKNKWVKDPHWIYPGDPLLVDGSRSTVAGAADAPAQAGDLAPKEVADLPPDSKTEPTEPASRPAAPSRAMRDELAFSIQDFLRVPYLAEKGFAAHMDELGALRIVGHQDPMRGHLGEGDVVYLAGGTDKGLKEGDRRLIVRLEKTKLFHPNDQRRQTPLGDVVQHVGILRISSVNPKGAVALVERCTDAVAVGQCAVPYQEPANMMLNLRSDIASPVPVKDLARTMYIQENHGHTATGEMLIVDKGEKDGLKVGDVLIGLRPRSFEVTQEKVVRQRIVEKTNYYLGQVMVVKVTPTSSTCRVLRAQEEIMVGDVMTR